MDVLFFHGGPGLNGNPEKNILTEKFKTKGFNLKCWNEPSVLRPKNLIRNHKNTFEDYLNSAELFLLENYNDQPLIIIGHSFGVHTTLHLVDKHPEKVKCVILISSNFSTQNTDINTFLFMVDDFEKHKDENGKLLRTVIKKYTGNFDENTQQGFAIVSQNPRLFDYYWHDKKEMQEFLSHYIAPMYALDVDGYFNVRKTWYEQNIKKSNVPVVAIHGKYDMVVSNDIEREKVKSYFNNVDFIEFNHAAHYPHIEETGLFLDILTNIKP